MEAKVAFAAGLFCVVFSMFGSSQDIPDDVVYTEVKKTLVNGTMGILRCRFKGDPNAVYWKKGSDPENTPSIISLIYGIKSGPRYEDGSCDIDGNYSLVIRNVRNKDAGRYICEVSNYKGIIIYNYTDVTITNSAVNTEQSVAVQKGKVGVLPCHVIIRPKRVSWVRGANNKLVSMDLSRSVVERSGPGYEEGLFNIDSEYSLVINDIKILHEDSYLCEVTDFDTGHLFRNVTGLNVFAFPLEPFPSIEECPRKRHDLSSCTLRVASETMLTCEVRQYYPVIDLYFMHGSLRVDSLETRVWNNSNGTRNKRITIATNSSRETVFECVATGLVGDAESRSMTIHLIRNVQQTRVVVAVVVPVILISTIIVIAVIKRRKRHLKRKYAKVPMVYKAKQRDLISYIELWTLMKCTREQNLSDKLGNVLYKLTSGECASRALHTDEDYYQEFCQWKTGYNGTCQREDFFDACRNVGLKSALDELQKYSGSTRAVTADDLEHTLWHIAESDDIIGLLDDLGALNEHPEGLKDKGKREVVEGAMNILKHWRDVNNFGNQEVMLSLAMETIKYTQSDKDFFRIPECQKRGLDKNEIHEFLSPQITSRHCTELIDATIAFRKKYPVATTFLSSKKRKVWIDNIIEENRTALFDSHQMIEDWWAERKCSNYEKRCRLRCAANDHKGRTGDLDVKEESDEKWPSSKKLDHIAKLVPQTRMIQLCEALNISYISDDLTNEKKRFKTMCRWRDGLTKLKKEEKSKVLSNALKSIGYDGLLSRSKSRFIYKAELVDMALDLIMEDFRPFADSLEINGTKLTSYRQEFRTSHLDRGTISLVLQLCKMIKNISVGDIRPNVCSILENAGYPNVIKRFIFASEPSFGELFAIATAVTQDDIPKGGEGTPDSSGESASRQRVCDLQRMLELTDEDIPNSNMASLLTLLKFWKERVCPGLLDHRVVLAEGLQMINKRHLVAEVISGRYQSRETSMDFIEDMLDRMDGSLRTSLERLVKSKEYRFLRKWFGSSDMTSQWIFDWVADWTKDMESSVKNYLKDTVRVKETSKRHRDFNDKLVERGFLGLAREIMNIEQVL